MEKQVQSTTSQTRANAHNKGFALISTVAIMVLLVLVVVGMLALSRSEVKKSKQDEHQLIAQANARMAAMIALGKLQETAGSDLITTSPAHEGLLGGSPATGKQRVTGVFSTEPYNTEDNSGPSWNQRSSQTFKTWLISGPNADEFSSIRSASNSDTVPLTFKDTPQDAAIAAPVVDIKDGNDVTGGYAWWVADLGQTASATIAATGEEENQFRAPSRFQIDKVAEDRGLSWFPSDEQDLEKIISLKTAETFASNNENLNAQLDWMNSTNYSVLSNPKRGGLKKDLTAAFSSGNVADLDTAGNRRMFPPASGATNNSSTTDKGGPRWEQPLDFYNKTGLQTLPITPQTETTMGIYPVIAGFTEFYGISNTSGYSHDSRYSNNRRSAPIQLCTMHMAPVVKLWNPYNRPLEVSDYTLVVGNSTEQYGGTDKGKNADNMRFTWDTISTAGSAFKLTRYAPTAMRFEHRYLIKEVNLQPGEAKIYSLQDNNIFADTFRNGTYTSSGPIAKPVGKVVDVIGEGFILGELKEGLPRGYSIWDMHFTRKDLTIEDVIARKDTTAYSTGRAPGAPGDRNDLSLNDGSNTFVFDTEKTTYGFTVDVGPTLNWNLQLYKDRVPRPVNPDEVTAPLVNIKNIHIGAKDATSSIIANKSDIVELPDAANGFFFPTDDTYIDSTWARKVSLRTLENQGDLSEDPKLYNVTEHGTKKTRMLADFNPRASTIGVWPEEYAKPAVDATFYDGTPIQVNGSVVDNTQKTLATPGVYQSGMVTDFTAQGLTLNDLTPTTFIGSSDETGNSNYILFEIPETSTPEEHFVSVGQLRHANLSIQDGSESYLDQVKAKFGAEDFFADSNRPAYPIGESWSDIRLDSNDNNFGRHEEVTYIDGSNTDTSTHYDMSWHLNNTLWDGFFFSARKDAASSHNSRILVENGKELSSGSNGITENAANLYLAGGFNVNSTSVEAWQAFLMSAMNANVGDQSVSSDSTPFARTSNPLGSEVENNADPMEDDVYAGFRSLSEDEAKELAIEIVKQVELRGPFYSLGDFVNRTTKDGADTEYRTKGVLQQAIDNTSINRAFDTHQIAKGEAGSIYDQEAYQGHIAAGVPGYLTQGDIMARLGHLMTTRSDTFKIHAYGSSLDSKGKVKAQAWCELIVQRTHEFTDNTQDPETEYAQLNSTNLEFGRKFKVTSFRWISPKEISQ